MYPSWLIDVMKSDPKKDRETQILIAEYELGQLVNETLGRIEKENWFYFYPIKVNPKNG